MFTVVYRFEIFLEIFTRVSLTRIKNLELFNNLILRLFWILGSMVLGTRSSSRTIFNNFYNYPIIKYFELFQLVISNENLIFEATSIIHRVQNIIIGANNKL